MKLINNLLKLFNKLIYKPKKSIDEIANVPYKIEPKTYFTEEEFNNNDLKRTDLKIIRVDGMTKGVKKIPKRVHKRHRIQKKWNKRYGFKFILIPDMKVYRYGNIVLGHPKAIDKLNIE